MGNFSIDRDPCKVSLGIMDLSTLVQHSTASNGQTGSAIIIVLYIDFADAQRSKRTRLETQFENTFGESFGQTGDISKSPDISQRKLPE